MRTLSFAVVITTVTVAHADPLEDHLQALRGYGVSGPHDATALIAGFARSDRSGRHSTRDEDPIGYFEYEPAKRDAVISGMGFHYTGPSSFAPKYDPADWISDPTSPVFYNGGVEHEARRPALAQAPNDGLNHARVVLSVDVEKDGKVFIQATEVPWSELAQRLVAVAKSGGYGDDSDVFLRADKSVEYGMVMRAMTEIRKAGFKKIRIVMDAPPR